MKITKKKKSKELHQSGDVSKLKEWYPSLFDEELEVGFGIKHKRTFKHYLFRIRKQRFI